MDIATGLVIGFGFGEIIGGRKEGDIGLLHFEWKVGRRKIHAHHWLVSLIVLIIYFSVVQQPNRFVVFVILGTIAHGFTYGDWHRFISNDY